LYGAPTDKNKVGVGWPTVLPEIGTGVYTWTEMAEAGAGTEVPLTSPNHIPPTSMPQNLPLDYQPPQTLNTTTKQLQQTLHLMLFQETVHR